MTQNWTCYLCALNRRYTQEVLSLCCVIYYCIKKWSVIRKPLRFKSRDFLTKNNYQTLREQPTCCDFAPQNDDVNNQSNDSD